jgi:SAM-dependent methyltransferase
MTTVAPFVTWESAVRWLRDQPEQRDLVLSCFYDDPLLGAAERYRCSTEWQAIKHCCLPTSRGKALDLGAGRGIASYALVKEGFAVTALEPDPSALIGAGAIRSLGEQARVSIDIRSGYAERIPANDGEFDLIFARAALHHARDLSAACREIFRVLKPGGRLVAVREHVISTLADLPAFLAIHPLHRLYGGEHAFLLREYRSAMEAAGFAVVRTLEPLRSPINLFPQTNESLRRAVCERLARIPVLSTVLDAVLSWRPAFDVLLWAMTRVDHRPGRLYSFIADKPERAR